MEYVIVPDGTYEYRFAMLPAQSVPCHPYEPPYDDILHPDRPTYILKLNVRYDFEFKKFHSVHLGPGKDVTVIWESDYLELMAKK